MPDLTSNWILSSAVALLLLSWLISLFVIFRIYAAIRSIDSPNNIVIALRELRAQLGQHGKRLQKASQRTEVNLDRSINEALDCLASEITNSVQEYGARVNQVASAQAQIDQRISAIEELLKDFRDFIADQRNEMRRYKDGYDHRLTKSVCLGLIRALDHIDRRYDDISDERALEVLQLIKDELEIVLDSQSYIRYVPEEGVICNENTAQIKAIEAVATDNGSQHGRVAKVLRSGWMYEDGDGQTRVIRPAEVAYFRAVIQ